MGSSILKLPVLFLRFQTEECVRRTNKSYVTGETTFNGDQFENRSNIGSTKDEKTLFWAFLMIFDHCVNP